MCTLPACHPDHSRFGRAWGQTAVAAASYPPSVLSFFYCFVISLQRTRSPAFHGLFVAAACCFYFVRPLSFVSTGYFSRSYFFVLSFIIFVAHVLFFFKLVLFNSRDCTSVVRSPGHVCLALGASGYLGARQSRGPPGRGAAGTRRARARQLRVG